MTLLTQSALLVAITAFSMGISVLARRTTNRLAQQYFIVSLIVWISFLSFFLKTAFQDELFARIQLVSWGWLGPAGMGLIPLLMGFEPPGWRWLRRISWSLALVLSVSSLAGLISSEDRGIWIQLLRFSPGVLMAQTWILLWTRRPLSIRDLLILGGAVLTLAFTPLDHMPWMGTTLPAFGNLFFCGYLILLGQAITRQKLVDLPGLIVRFVVLVVLALGFTGLYLLVATWSEATPAVFLLHSFAVSFCMVLLLDPLQAGVAYLTRRLLAQGRTRRLDLDLESLERELQSIQDPGLWQQSLERALCRIFGATRSGFTRHASVSDDQGTIASEILRRRAMQEVLVVVRSLIESERLLSASRRERDRLEALGVEMARSGCDIIIPFFDAELMGWIWLSGVGDDSRLTPLGSAALLGAIERFARRIGPVMRAMLRIRSLGEQERLATLGELSAGLAHEIRNPLGAIQGAVELLPESPWRRVIEQEIRRLEGLVRQFLELSRKRDSDMAWVDASRWLTQIRSRIETGEVKVTSLSERADLFTLGFVGDPERLLQVVDNWVRNAHQAGSSQTEVGLDWTEGSGEIGIFVQDNGEGIPETELQKIFAPFYTTRSEGTGLGLSICRQIAQNHEGRIEVQSSLGKGTRFTFWLATAVKPQETR